MVTTCFMVKVSRLGENGNYMLYGEGEQVGGEW